MIEITNEQIERVRHKQVGYNEAFKFVAAL